MTRNPLISDTQRLEFVGKLLFDLKERGFRDAPIACVLEYLGGERDEEILAAGEHQQGLDEAIAVADALPAPNLAEKLRALRSGRRPQIQDPPPIPGGRR